MSETKLTPDDIARGLHWCDTIDTDPVAKDLLANLVVLNARELLELAAIGMQGDPAREAEAGAEDRAGKQTPDIYSKVCNGCGKSLRPENAWMEDGCPCNTPKGANDGNQVISDWRRDAQQQTSRDLTAALRTINSITDENKRLQAECATYGERLESMVKAASADAKDLAKMRDGTKLTRAGLVMAIQYLQEDLAALRSERDELAKWKSLQQQALASMAMTLQDAGYKGDGVAGGVGWLVAERDELVNLLDKIDVAWKAVAGFAVCESNGPENKYRITIDYRSLEQAQKAYRAMMDITAAIELAKARKGGAT